MSYRAGSRLETLGEPAEQAEHPRTRKYPGQRRAPHAKREIERILTKGLDTHQTLKLGILLSGYGLTATQ